ncbi:MAG: nickel pincer cofactor biosynthesis protein LarC, partial [bacterium]
MKIAYLDCSLGVSGDMLIGCLIDYGFSFEVLLEQLKKLPISSFSITKRKKGVGEIKGTKITVKTKTRLMPDEMLSLIKESSFSDEIKDKVNRVLKRIFEAEMKVHQTKNPHLHELGSLDTIIDVVSCILGFHLLGIEKLWTSYINLGKPSPATLHLLSGFGINSTREDYELTTPTGSAIISTLADGYGYIPEMELKGVGIGFGSYKLPKGDFLRMIVGEKTERDEIVLVETNIDDIPPQIFEYVIERLLDEGALDAWLTPIQMKKTRPAIKLSCLVEKQKEDKIIKVIFSETSSIGIRKTLVERVVLQRRQEKIKTEYGEISGKRIIFDKKERIIPEYEDLKKKAKELKIPLIELLEKVK